MGSAALVVVQALNGNAVDGIAQSRLWHAVWSALFLRMRMCRFCPRFSFSGTACRMSHCDTAERALHEFLSHSVGQSLAYRLGLERPDWEDERTLPAPATFWCGNLLGAASTTPHSCHFVHNPTELHCMPSWTFRLAIRYACLLTPIYSSHLTVDIHTKPNSLRLKQLALTDTVSHALLPTLLLLSDD